MITHFLNQYQLPPIKKIVRNDDPERVTPPAAELSTPLTKKKASAMAETAGAVLKKAGYPAKARGVFELLTEDILGLICERNRDSGKELSHEYTLILEEDGARMILRDDGKALELTDTEIVNTELRASVFSDGITALIIGAVIIAAALGIGILYKKRQKGGAAK